LRADRGLDQSTGRSEWVCHRVLRCAGHDLGGSWWPDHRIHPDHDGVSQAGARGNTPVAGSSADGL